MFRQIMKERHSPSSCGARKKSNHFVELIHSSSVCSCVRLVHDSTHVVADSIRVMTEACYVQS